MPYVKKNTNYDINLYPNERIEKFFRSAHIFENSA